jgi:AcrR family transcriptional regulator
MEMRDRILEAARRVYEQHGFRGATTRLIAGEAGVNEVTLFRTFGSKAALLDAMLSLQVASAPVPILPDEPRDPEDDIVHWCTVTLQHMRDHRALLRKAFGELEERPDACVTMCQGPSCSAMLLTDYASRLQSSGLADRNADVQTAVSMLMSTLLGDALLGEVMPNAFPGDPAQAPRRYVRTFLRAMGVRVRLTVPPHDPGGAP